MSKAGAGAQAYPRIRFSGRDTEIAAVAARDLSEGLAMMLGNAVSAYADASLAGRELRIDLGESAIATRLGSITLEGKSFDISRSAGSIAIRAGSERALIHAGADLLEKFGARFAPGVAPLYPRIDASRLAALAPWRVVPAFNRRALASDIMTWHYKRPTVSSFIFEHDREFIPWMAAVASTRSRTSATHATTRLKIDETAAAVA